MKKKKKKKKQNKTVPKLRQEVKVKVDIVTSDDIKIYYTGKFQDFTARYIINQFKPGLHSTTILKNILCLHDSVNLKRTQLLIGQTIHQSEAVLLLVKGDHSFLTA